MKAISILCLILTFALASCYDDKGNYDYSDLNEISVKLWEDNSPSVALGDTLQIEPILNFAYDSVNVNLEYEWTYDDKLVGTERNLYWILDTTGTAWLTLRIRDLDNGMTYMGSGRLTIGSIYSLNTEPLSFFILSEKDGKSLLTFARESYDEDNNLYWKIMEDVYKCENDEELGSEPLFFRKHSANVSNSAGHMTIFQNGGQGSVDLEIMSMKKDILLKDAFSGQTYPEGYQPKDADFLGWVHLIMNEDGKIYSKVKETNDLYQSGYYIHSPLLFENKEIRADRFVPVRGSSKNFTLLHEVGTSEVPENRLIIVYGNKEANFYDVNLAGKIVAFPEPEEGWPVGFVPLTDMGDNELLHAVFTQGSRTAWGLGTHPDYHLFLKTPEGKYLYQYAALSEDYTTQELYWAYDEPDDPLRVMELPQPPVPLEDCKMTALTSTQNLYLFFAHGQDIYYMSLDTPEDGLRHYYTCKSNVVVMDGQDYQGNYLMVGLEDGSLLVLNVQNAKNVFDDAEKIVWESDPALDLGRIVTLEM